MVGCCTHPACAGHILTAEGERMVSYGTLVEDTPVVNEGRWIVRPPSRRRVLA